MLPPVGPAVYGSAVPRPPKPPQPSPLRLAAHREAAGLSVAQLAAKSGVSAANLYRLENGDVQGISWGTLARLAAAFDVTPGALFAPPKRKRPAKPAGE